MLALGALESTPDYLYYLDDWLKQLQTEGMDFMQVTSIRSHAVRFFREKLLSIQSPTTIEINEFCDQLVKNFPPTDKLFPYLTNRLPELKKNFTEFRDEELMARLVLRAIKSCVDQI
jgi:hypothetical protein